MLRRRVIVQGSRPGRLVPGRDAGRSPRGGASRGGCATGPTAASRPSSRAPPRSWRACSRSAGRVRPRRGSIASRSSRKLPRGSWDSRSARRVTRDAAPSSRMPALRCLSLRCRAGGRAPPANGRHRGHSPARGCSRACTARRAHAAAGLRLISPAGPVRPPDALAVAPRRALFGGHGRESSADSRVGGTALVDRAGAKRGEDEAGERRSPGRRRLGRAA